MARKVHTRIGKAVRRVLVAAAAAAVFVGAVLYVQASRIPAAYRPVQITAEQRRQAAQEFLNRKILDEFGNEAQKNEPFVWAVSEEELNRYLAAMDEIAASAPSVSPGAVYRAMQAAGVADPAVALREDVLTVMVRSIEYGKIVSADVAFSFTPEGKLRVRLLGARAGRLALPQAWVETWLERLKQILPTAKADRLSPARSDLSGFFSEDLGSVLSAVLAAIDDEPISTELIWRLNKKRVRIADIEIAGGVLRLHVVPVPRRTRAASRRPRGE